MPGKDVTTMNKVILMGRAKAGINAPLTGFQTVDYSNQAEQRIVLLMSIQ